MTVAEVENGQDSDEAERQAPMRSRPRPERHADRRGRHVQAQAAPGPPGTPVANPSQTPPAALSPYSLSLPILGGLDPIRPAPTHRRAATPTGSPKSPQSEGRAGRRRLLAGVLTGREHPATFSTRATGGDRARAHRPGAVPRAEPAPRRQWASTLGSTGGAGW